MDNLQEDMNIESLQETIRSVLKEFEVYDDGDEDLVNGLSERIFEDLREENI